MWLDETQEWLMASDAHSISGMLENVKYSGHPHVWDFLLFILSRFTHNPFAVQVLHICISSLAVFLFLKYAPAPGIQKLCIVFGYYFLFEYNLISRNYSISWLCLVIFCVLFSMEKRNYLLLTLTLFILANTHLFSLVCSLPLFFLVFQSFRNDSSVRDRELLFFLTALFISGVAISIWSIIPADGTDIMRFNGVDLFSTDRFSKSFSFFVKGFYPIPDFTSTSWWNTNFIVSHLKVLGIILTPFLVIAPLFLFHESRKIIFFFYFSVLGIVLLEFYLKLFGGTRYAGFAFMILIVSLWLNQDKRNNSRPLFNDRWKSFFTKWKKYFSVPFLMSVFICQLFAGFFAFYSDYKNPFSEGKNVADYIRANSSSDALVIAQPFFSGPQVSAYLHKDLFYPDMDNFESFWQWKSY
jgi:hypothetical protein